MAGSPMETSQDCGRCSLVQPCWTHKGSLLSTYSRESTSKSETGNKSLQSRGRAYGILYCWRLQQSSVLNMLVWGHIQQQHCALTRVMGCCRRKL